MEKIRKIDVGTLLINESNSTFEDDIRKRSYVVFENGGNVDDSCYMYELNGKHCYIVSKEDMDALKDRNTALEEMNCTPVWDENQKLKKRVKELEGQLKDAKKESDKKPCEVYMETNATLYSGAYSLIAIGKELEDLKKQAEQMEELEKENQALKDRNGELEKKLEKMKKDLDFVENNAKFWHNRAKELEKDRDNWKNRFTSVVTDFSKLLEANGIEFTAKAIDGNKWNVIIDIPELKEAKAKVAALEKKLRTEDSMVTYWRERKEEEEEYHQYWLHSYNLAVVHAASKGVSIFMTGEDAENNVGVIQVKNEKVEELEAKWSAMLQALKEKGVEVLYMGEEDGKPIVDVKIPAIGDLKKELDDLKNKTVAEVRYEWKPNCFTMIYTKCDGSKQTVGMDLADDTDEKCTMGAFVCRVFNIPQCKECKNHRYFANSGHYCHLPDSKYTIPGMFHVNSLTEEDAEGPACDKFEDRRE